MTVALNESDIENSINKPKNQFLKSFRLYHEVVLLHADIYLSHFLCQLSHHLLNIWIADSVILV